MKLTDLLKEVNIKNTIGNLDIDITNIHSDSRKIKDNGLFIAINGFTKNGIDFIPSAIQNGANAVIVEPDVDIEELNLDIPVIQVENTRKALAQTACAFYDYPAKKLKIIVETNK